MTRTSTIPAEIVSVVRSALLTQLGDAAAGIEDATNTFQKEQHPERFTEPFARFDAWRGLLALIGWSNEPVPIDLDEHGELLAAAIVERLEIDRDCVAGYTPDEQAEREAVERDIEAMERFMTANNLRREV